jgi:polysaccharide biosynthesis protein PelA
MNGGNTIASRLYPGIAGVAPRVVQWGDELQINAANQNEFMYANGWSGPFYGGFADVIDTFERTETPRRLKPVNVYYHFYSATSLSSLRALEKIHHWCQQQPLHPVDAADFARLTADAHRARTYQLGPRHWLLSSGGHLRSYRLPADLGVPDLARCRGVTGYTSAGDALFISTDGSPRVELQLTQAKPEPPAPRDAYLQLVSCTNDLRFEENDGWRATFTASAGHPSQTAELHFAGLPAKASCDLLIGQKASTVTTDAQGHLHLSLPQNTRVTLDAHRSRYAVVQ